jgi:hypothetical protein
VSPQSAESPAPQRVPSPEPKRLLAASAPWLGALLNVLPGLGTGYVYQRRWRAWWITALLAIAWSAVALALATDEAGVTPTLIAPAGLLALSLTTAAEAFLAARKARHD